MKNLYDLYAKPQELDHYDDLGKVLEDDELRWRDAQGQLHRDGDLPSVINNDYGSQEWYQHGKRHRDHDKPAVIYFDGPNGSVGTQKWYQNDQVHRDGDKPAIIHADGSESWYQHDRLHRVGGPVKILTDGYRAWCLNGEPHRVGGPAIYILKTNYEKWYRKGVPLKPDQIPPEELAAWQKKKRQGKADEPI